MVVVKKKLKDFNLDLASAYEIASIMNFNTYLDR